MTTAFKRSRADYPLGILAIYDNGGRTSDRYMVVFTPYNLFGGLRFPTLSMSAKPSHPQGVGLRGEVTHRPTRRPGERVIGMNALPDDCRRCVEDDLLRSEVECPHCGGLGPELINAGPHAGERCRVCVNH
jgi:hypothetical protein